ncbi:unnamed protein product [Brachionus calyciflorus]|uniref:Uncharacterized protein n=1 Tax=Brachionus calyciflorus TaxID=104777 RepID=A0A814K079_9BILA|nr:unnamed protein product [Brachionus calyciflorus]
MSKIDDVIMYHNEYRNEFKNSFALKPAETFQGINSERTQYIDQDFKTTQPNSKYTTTLNNPTKSFAHVGTGVHNNYQRNISDPRFNIPVYGNSKPQLLAYSTTRSNLLFN